MNKIIDVQPGLFKSWALRVEMASVGKKNLDAEGRQIAEDLKLIQYDIVAGKGYLSKDFFKVHSE